MDTISAFTIRCLKQQKQILIDYYLNSRDILYLWYFTSVNKFSILRLVLN